MKDMATALLTEELAKKDDYARVVLDAIKTVEPITRTLVPKNSLIREFISGGIYDNIY